MSREITVLLADDHTKLGVLRQLDRFQLQNHLSDDGIRILCSLYSRMHCRPCGDSQQKPPMPAAAPPLSTAPDSTIGADIFILPHQALIGPEMEYGSL